MKTAVTIIGCHRLEYFKRTINSLLQQLNGRRLIVVLDIHPKHKGDHKRHIEFVESLDYTNISIWPNKKPRGLGKTMIKARDVAFFEEGFDRAFILEDDLVLGKSYIEHTERMMDWAESRWPNIAMCQSYQDNETTDDPHIVRPDYGHYWGYLQNKWSWEIICEDLYTFKTKYLKDQPYSLRPHGAIQKWRQTFLEQTSRTGLDQNHKVAKAKISAKITGQDAVTLCSLYKNNLIKLQSTKSMAKYIGEFGQHFNPVVFKKQGLDKQNPILSEIQPKEFKLES